MTTSSRPPSHRFASVAGRIALTVLPLGAALTILAGLLPAPQGPSDPRTLATRIVAGVVISAVALAAVLVATRREGKPLGDAGLTSIRAGWRLAVWGALVWVVPAAATFVVLALLGTPLTVTVPAAELARTVPLLLLAVLLTEALPEEAVFRGHVTTTVAAVTRGWWVIIAQAVLFTVFAAVLRQTWHPADLSLFLAMGIGLGYLRATTGSVWMPIGFHTAFQTGSQLVLTHEAVHLVGGTGAAGLALGAIPFAAAAVLVSTTGVPRLVAPGAHAPR
ncbi:CPBP family intramembrane glutamic endopeptidase [Desertihabitans aurantiacus]|uniref:CPBP family intramembrane glutamic endopeptidase n=1 Tax=Desertihabitans aurantiacus TaxID=2282477 RepID=UPI000DF795DA|nr:CPBP family intramembrane glutamic endopeptidase [Desertihabitans aurantiacus]